MFLFEKAISAKVVSRGNLSILCRWHEKFSRTWERNKNRPLWKCWQSLMEEWANIQDSFESLPKLCKLWIFSSVHSTPPSATRISMLFFPRNWPSNMSYYVKGCFFPLSQIIPMVDPFCTKPRINNTNVASAQLSQHNMALQLIWYMNYEDSSLSIKTTYVQLYLKRCCRNLFAAMYGANYKRSDPELG